MPRTSVTTPRWAPVRRAAVLLASLGLLLTTAPAAVATEARPAVATEARPAVATEARPAVNAPVAVKLTVTGPSSTVFNGTITTTGHTVTTASGGTHTCDGTNNGANPSPGATPTAALDDAAQQEGFTWDGTWYASFDDYFVTTIAGQAGGADAYWNIAVNGTPTPVGGCQFRIKAGDQVSFTWTLL